MAEALILPTPYDEKQSREIMSRLNNVPEILRQAQQNLVSPPSPFAKMAIDSLVGIQNVALVPYTPEELVARAEQEFRRAAAFEALEANRNRSVPPLVMAPTLMEFITRNRTSEAEVREFLKPKTPGRVRCVHAHLDHLGIGHPVKGDRIYN